MLAMAMLPTLGRVASASTAADAGILSALATMCMPSGLGAESPALRMASGATDPLEPAPPMPAQGEHCVYCLLLHTLHLPASVAVAASPRRALAASHPPAPRVHLPVAETAGSGPRGPPQPFS